MSKTICPYHFGVIERKDVDFKCPKCGKVVNRTKREKMFNIISKCKNKDCYGAYATQLCCKVCDKPLPKDIFDFRKNLRFSLIGTIGSGKTSFLTTMLHEFKILDDFPIAISWMDTETGIEFGAYEEIIYSKDSRLEHTSPGEPVPSQWILRNRKHMTDKKIPTYSMTIFDGAGEHSQAPDSTTSTFIAGAKELVIIVDPLALRSYNNEISDEVKARAVTAGGNNNINPAISMLNEVLNYYREACNIKGNILIDKDVAVVFSKIDEIVDSFDKNSTILKNSPHVERRGFVENDSKIVDREIREWLTKKGESELINMLESNINPKRIRFFGISSFGMKHGIGGIEPFRVLDPLLWMLANEGVIDKIVEENVEQSVYGKDFNVKPSRLALGKDPVIDEAKSEIDVDEYVL